MDRKHPLTDFVLDLINKKKRGVDRFDIALALGAPEQNFVWASYLIVVDDVLDAMTHEGSVKILLRKSTESVHPRYGINVTSRAYRLSTLKGNTND